MWHRMLVDQLTQVAFNEARNVRGKEKDGPHKRRGSLRQPAWSSTRPHMRISAATWDSVEGTCWGSH
eukprot:2619331-Amphidinium_carterae.1